jgi:uncharacterized protein (DUF2225 family)
MNITKALKELCPNCSFSVINEDYNRIIWNNNNPLPLPTKEVVESKALEIQNKDAHIYNRANEYPDFKDYLDGIVKGDQAQIDKYIADCLAVKAKYPKE